MSNRVKFGLTNVHYAVITEQDGVDKYGTPKRLYGGVSLSIEPKGEENPFYADNIVFYNPVSNQGYEGTLEIAELTTEFKSEVLGEKLDADDGVITEFNTTQPNRIALLFEFDGDKKATRHVLYSCTVTRPNVESETKSDSIEPKPSELKFSATPRATDGAVKTSTVTEGSEDIYNNWFTKVYEKTTLGA